MELFKGIEPKDTKDRVARILSSVSAIIALAYLFGAPIKVDQYFIAMMVLAFLPWLGFFIKKGGKDGIEFPEPTGSTERTGTKSLSDEINAEKTQKIELSKEARFVLKTLDHYQRECFGLRNGKRWVFTVPYGHPAYVPFQVGILELDKHQLVSFDTTSGRFGLSDKGVKYLWDYSDEFEQMTNYLRFKD